MEADATSIVLEKTVHANPSPKPGNYLNLRRKVLNCIQNNSFDYPLHRRRIAIVINHVKSDILGVGTDKDFLQIIESLNKLKFEVTPLQNSTFFDIDEQIGKVARMNMEDVSCIVVIVMTHEGPGGRLKAHDSDYLESEIWEPFKTVPKIIDVPKLFIIQTCRETIEDLGHQINSVKCDGIQYGGCKTLPSMINMLWVYSSFDDNPLYKSHNGSCFIRTLCEMLDRHGTELDILQILTLVNGAVARGFSTPDGMKQMPQVNFTLIKTLSFKPINERRENGDYDAA